MRKVLVLAVVSIQLLFLVSSIILVAPVKAQLLEVDSFPSSRASVRIIGSSGSEIVRLSGPTTVHVEFEGATEGAAVDDDGDDLDEVTAEIMAMQLRLEFNSGLGHREASQLS